MKAATAVLYDHRSKSSVTRWIRRCAARSTSAAASPSAAGTASDWPDRRAATRAAGSAQQPSTPTPSQSTSSPGGPTNRWARRRASAPSVSKISSGATRLPFDFDIFVPPRRIMPWVNSRANGSRRSVGRHAEVGQRLGVEAGVHQVEDGVLDTADVLVDRHPLGDGLVVERRVLVPRVAEPQEVPGRVDEGVHGVGLADRRTAAHRARRVQEALVVPERRLAGRQELDVVGRDDRQLVVGHRNGAVVGAVDDRDRAAPEPLPRQQPVAQAEVDLAGRRCPASSSHSIALAFASATGRPSSHWLLMAGPSPM